MDGFGVIRKIKNFTQRREGAEKRPSFTQERCEDAGVRKKAEL